MNKQTRILIGLSIIFVILIVLSLAIYLNSRDLSCDKCQVSFKNTEMFGFKLDQPIITYVNATDLFDELGKDRCIIKWSRTQGYYYGN